jgi:hypothetical protein
VHILNAEVVAIFLALYADYNSTIPVDPLYYYITREAVEYNIINLDISTSQSQHTLRLIHIINPFNLSST